MSTNEPVDILCLQTSLFNSPSDLQTAVNTMDDTKIETIELHPRQMGEADWDAVVEQVLHAKKVITL